MSADIKIRKFFKECGLLSLNKIVMDRKCDIDQLARFWIQTFGFFYNSVLQHPHLKILREKVEEHQRTTNENYKAYRAGEFAKRIQQLMEKGSFYGGDDPKQMRQSHLYYLSYLPFSLGQLKPCPLKSASDQAFIKKIRKEYRDEMLPLLEEWIEGKKEFKQLSESEQIQLEKILFSKAGFIWRGDCYNWYNVAQLWASLEREPYRFLEVLPNQFLLAGDSTPSLTDVMREIIQKEGEFLSSLSFREFTAYLSALSIGPIWDLHFSREIIQEFAQKESLRQQALLYAHRSIEKPSSHFFKCLDIFITIRKHIRMGEEVSHDYDEIFDWIYFSSEQNLLILLNQITTKDLRHAFQTVQQWRKLDAVQIKNCFLLFKLIAEDKLGWDSFYHQISKLSLFSLSEKLDIVLTLCTSRSRTEWKSYIRCYEECIRFLHDYQVPLPFLKCLWINWFKSEMLPNILRHQLSLLRLFQELIGIRLNSVTAYVWLVFCLNGQRVEEILQEFERGSIEIAALASNPQISPQLIQSFQLNVASLVEISSERKDWQLVQKNLLSQVTDVESSFPPEWQHLLLTGMEFAYLRMRAETSTLLTFSILPIGGHLYFSNFICKEAILDQAVKIGEEDVYFQRSYTLYPYSFDLPHWRGIYRSWDLPSDKKRYPIFNLVMVDLRTFQTTIIREPVEIAWEHFCNHPELLEALQQVAVCVGEDRYEELPRDQQAPEDRIQIPEIEGLNTRELLYQFIEKIKVQFRLGLFKLNPYFAKHLPPNQTDSLGSLFLDKAWSDKALNKRYDKMIETMNLYLTKEINKALENFDVLEDCENRDEEKMSCRIVLAESCFTEPLREMPLLFSYRLIFEVSPMEPCMDPKSVLSAIDPESILKEVVLSCNDQTQIVRYPKAFDLNDFRQMLRWQLKLLMHKMKDAESDPSSD